MFLCCLESFIFFFFFNDTPTTDIYTLSLHDALPISAAPAAFQADERAALTETPLQQDQPRSEEHTSELQSLRHLVCRLLLEKKKKNKKTRTNKKKKKKKEKKIK